MKKLLLWILILMQMPQSRAVPLFDTYPQLKQKIAHKTLGDFPTPIEKLSTLEKELEINNLYIKSDNLSSRLFGGNKVRKLEFLLADALSLGATGILTYGFAGSNFVCATAVHAKQCNLDCFCMLLPQRNTQYLQRNLLIGNQYTANQYLCHTPAQREVHTHRVNEQYRRKTGKNLYFIPSGGSNEVGTLGFVNAAFELKEQIKLGLMPEPDYIYIALGSCGSAAGLMLGLYTAGLKTKVIPICVEPREEPSKEQKVISLFTQANKLLHDADHSFPLFTITEDDFSINYDFVGDGYAHITDHAKEAIQMLWETEDIKLDGTYAGKAFAGMISDIKKHNMKDKIILFWNTFCSGAFSEIIDDTSHTNLPVDFEQFFTTIPLQINDQGI